MQFYLLIRSSALCNSTMFPPKMQILLPHVHMTYFWEHDITRWDIAITTNFCCCYKILPIESRQLSVPSRPGKNAAAAAAAAAAADPGKQAKQGWEQGIGRSSNSSSRWRRWSSIRKRHSSSSSSSSSSTSSLSNWWEPADTSSCCSSSRLAAGAAAVAAAAGAAAAANARGNSWGKTTVESCSILKLMPLLFVLTRIQLEIIICSFEKTKAKDRSPAKCLRIPHCP